MSDFKKNPTPPTDDYSPAPQLGTFSVAPEAPSVSQEQLEAEKENEQQAAPYWHPAWAKVQERFEEILESYGGNNAAAYKDLPPDEFKIRMMSESVVHAEISKIMEDVKSAVEQSQQQPKRPKQSKSTGA